MPKQPRFQLAALLLIAVIAASTTFYANVSAKTNEWSKVYSNSNGRSNCLIEVEGGYVFAGVDNGCYLLAKADLSGEIVWWRTYQKGEATCVVQTSDGGYALAGQGEANFIKTDSEGNPLLRTCYTYSNDTYKTTTIRFNSIAQTPEDGFVLTGKTPSGIMLGWDYTLKIDKNGEVIWGKTYGEKYGNSVATNVVAVSDGYILTVDALIKINQNGDVLWRRPLGIANSLAKTADDGLLLVSPTGYTGNQALIRTDSKGNVLWNRTYQLESARATHLRSAIETSDGGILVCSWAYPEWECVAWVVITDSAGNPLWDLTSKTVYNYNSQAYSIIEASDGAFVYSGSIVNVSHTNETQVWLAKTSTPDKIPAKTPTPTQQPTPTRTPTITQTLIADPPIEHLQPFIIGGAVIVVIGVFFSALLYARHRKAGPIST